MGSLGNCCCGCLIHEDLFARSPGTPLRGSWCDEEGDYEIVAGIVGEQCGGANCLVAGALAILNIQHPVPDGSMIVTIETCDEVENSGEKYRVLVNLVPTTSGDPVVCDSSDYYFVEFERQGLNDSVLRLGIVSGGVESILKEDYILGLLGFSRTVQATISESTLCGSVSNSTLSLVGTVHAGLFADGYYSGFSLSDVGMTIKSFRFYQHHVTQADCGACICTCDDKEWPPTLNVRIYPDPSNCVRLDLLEPCEFEIEWDRVQGAWVGSGMCCDDQQEWDVQVACISGSDGNPYLGISIGIGCTASADLTQIDRTQDCPTLCATFGPLNVSADDLTCFCSSVPFDINNPGGRGSCDYFIEVCA